MYKIKNDRNYTISQSLEKDETYVLTTLRYMAAYEKHVHDTTTTLIQPTPTPL